MVPVGPFALGARTDRRGCESHTMPPMTSLAVPASGRVRRAIEYVVDLWNRREFAVALGLGNLKARNASTAFGLFWWVLNPILLGGVYYLVFGLLFRGNRPPDFLTYLLSGMFVFHFTAQSMTGGANSIIQNARLLANLRFPRLVLPISTLIEATVGFIASIGVFMLIAIVTGQANFTHRLVYLPVILAIHVVFNLGLGALIARLAVPFRDINNLVPYVNRVWLYLTPIIWPLSFLDRAEPWHRALIQSNPMYDMVGLYRSALMGTPLVMDQVVGAVLWAAAVGVLGVALFVRYEGHIVRYL